MINGEKETYFENGDENREVVKLREILGNLEQIKPPADFNFRLKARWQAEKTKTAKRPMFAVPNLAYGFGALALCAFGVWFALSFAFIKPVPEVESVSATKPAPTNEAVKTPAPENLVTNEAQPTVEPIKEIPVKTVPQTATKRRETLLAKTEIAVNKPTNSTKKASVKIKKDDEILSKTSAITRTPKSLTPPGIPDTINGEKGLKADDSLRIFGIETKSEGENLRVENVGAGSLAEDAGLKKGDLIEKFNGKKPREISANEFKEITLTIKRENKFQDIKIAPKP